MNKWSILKNPKGIQRDRILLRGRTGDRNPRNAQAGGWGGALDGGG